MLVATALRLPERLEKAPLLESVFELRFDPSREGISDILPGVLYQALGNTYPDSGPLPLANVPREIRSADPNLHYIASHKLIGPAGDMFVGDRVVGLTQPAPYPGWDGFRDRIRELVQELRSLPFIRRVERFSIKSVNLIETGQRPQLSLIRLNVELAGVPVGDRGFQLRTELVEGSVATIVQIATNAQLATSVGSPPRQGLLVTIDSIENSPEANVWATIDQKIENLHHHAKQAFFSMLTRETLESLGPVY